MCACVCVFVCMCVSVCVSAGVCVCACVCVCVLLCMHGHACMHASRRKEWLENVDAHGVDRLILKASEPEQPRMKSRYTL